MKKIFFLFLMVAVYSCASSIDWDNYAKAKPSKASIEDATKANLFNHMFHSIPFNFRLYL